MQYHVRGVTVDEVHSRAEQPCVMPAADKNIVISEKPFTATPEPDYRLWRALNQGTMGEGNQWAMCVRDIGRVQLYNATGTSIKGGLPTIWQAPGTAAGSDFAPYKFVMEVSVLVLPSWPSATVCFT